MTSWSLKKNQQEILKVSHAFVLMFFKDFFGELIKKKEKAEILDVDINKHRKSMYWEVSQQRKSVISKYLLDIKSF